jgi:16S rRNA (cytidine1402-2'-O)-methyltransferase
MARLILLNMPIGNLSDMTVRVKDALETGTYFAVEDSRSFREFLTRLGISTEGKRVLSLHDQSSEAKFERLLEVVWQGNDLYVCSEAGSPVLSDPAFPLVRLAYEKGVEVDTYSGISAVTAALELAGLPPLPYAFHGFLPRDEGKIRGALSELGQGTHIFFEAPGRIRQTLEIALGLWPEAEYAVVKEMGKTYQKVVRFTGKEGFEAFSDVMERGEFVWLVHLATDPRPRLPENVRQIALEILQHGPGQKTLSRLLGEILERPSKEIYAELMQLMKQ